MSDIHDSFYTPTSAAIELIAGVGAGKPEVICDSSVGDGSLLLAAKERWPKAKFYGFDIDRGSLKRASEEGIHSGRRDALVLASRRGSKLWNTITGRIDLFVLNPPFSSRGCRKFEVFEAGLSLKATKPLCFLIDAVLALRVGGKIAIVLPYGAIERDADKRAWQWIRKCCDVVVKDPDAPIRWNICEVQVVFVYLTKFDDVPLESSILAKKDLMGELCPAKDCSFVVFRGGVSNSKSDVTTRGRSNFVHTSNLKNGKLANVSRRSGLRKRLLCGPGILIPRVGKPDRRKIVVIDSKYEFVPSDCVFFVKLASLAKAISLASAIKNNWREFEEAYSGSCAKHLTLTRLENLLSILRPVA